MPPFDEAMYRLIPGELKLMLQIQSGTPPTSPLGQRREYIMVNSAARKVGFGGDPRPAFPAERFSAGCDAARSFLPSPDE